MSNEELVTEIRNGFSVSDNMQLLYENNLGLLKKIVMKYAAYEPMEDLLQETFFGLWEAVQHYETDKNVQFMTYAEYWIRQSVQRYIEKCGSTVRIPSHTRQKMTKCKRAIQQLEQEQGREPTATDVAALTGLSEKEILEIESYMQGVGSLDAPIADDDNFTLSDTLQADFSLENDTVDKIYNEHSKNELWGIVERYTGQRESHIIKQIFINNMSMAAVARAEGISLGRIRQIKEKGLRRLRIGKAKRELLQKFDVVESHLYQGTFENFRQHDSSIVEYLAIEHMEAKERYERHIKEIEERRNKRIASGN